MTRLIARRAGFALLLVLVVTMLAAALVTVAPGDITSETLGSGASAETIARERARLGLDQPPSTRFAAWLRRALRLDFGRSIKYERPVAPLVVERARNTALLGLAALLLGTALGVPLGVIAAGSRHAWLRRAVAIVSTALLSLPPLVFALLLLFVALRTRALPAGGMSAPGPDDAGWLAAGGDLVRHLVVPALALGLPLAAMLERLQARALSESLREPFILAAAARGVPRRRLLWHHGFRHALAPVLAVYGLVSGSLLGGSFIVEIVTAWPGLGRLTYDALVSRDLNLAAGCAAAGAVMIALATFLSDVAVAFADPRTRE
jgi:peptide/nickel transport system permease protein